MSARFCFSSPQSTHFFLPIYSISVQIIPRHYGKDSAGYGFVTYSTEEAAKQAIEELCKTDLVLDGRVIVVQPARPPRGENKGPRPPKKFRKKSSGRRGPRSARGEVTDAEVNGEITDKAETAPDTAPATEGSEKPKKKKKKSSVCALSPATSPPFSFHF